MGVPVLIDRMESSPPAQPCEWCSTPTVWLYILDGVKVRACQPEHARKAAREKAKATDLEDNRE